MAQAPGFSHIVLGGGSAGCVLANRLSALGRNRVLLIEAGPDTPPDAIPEDIADSQADRALTNPRYTWTGMRAEQAARHGNAPARPARYEQSRVMGGGSSINGQVVTRADAADYDLWRDMGAEGWGWADVLPCFRRVETDLDFAGPDHGADGPIPVRRIPRARWDAFTLAAAESLAAQGFAFHPDMNAAMAEGFAPVPINTGLDGRRVSAARGYLDAATRARPNLVIRAGTAVRRILFEGRRAVGVEVTDASGGVEAIQAPAIILSAGAILSPTLLMRSGVGPAGHLRALGLAVVHDLPGVGQNLQEHAAIHVSAYLRAEGRRHADTGRRNHIYLRYASGVEGTRPPDMLLNFAHRSAWHAVGRRLATIQAYILHPFSRGWVRLAAPDLAAPPEIAFNHFSDPRDLTRLMDAVRRAAALFASPAIARLTDHPFATSYSDRVRAVGRHNWRNAALMGVLGAVLDIPGPVRRAAIRHLINDAPELPALLADEDALADHVRRNVNGVWHASGTCRLGAADDPAAVLDPRARLRGIAGLRVADTSIMPEVPRCNTNLPAMMIGERVAEMILAEG